MKTVINQYIEAYLRKEKYYSDLAKVVSVDDTTKKAVVEIVNSDLQVKSRTHASINVTGGFYIKPSVDSYVIINWVNTELSYIALYSEVDAIIFQNGANLGVPKTPETVDRLNLIEQDINDLKQVFNTWVPVATDGGAALKAAATTWFGATLTETVNDDIQNENFKQ